MPRVPSPTGVRVLRTLLAALAALALLLALPGAAQADVRSKYAAEYPGVSTWLPNDGRPLVGRADIYTFEMDQRQMSLGQQAQYVVYLRSTSSAYEKQFCGRLVFEVTRYQAYAVYWGESMDGPTTRFLYRGGLVADRSRPYVGVFWGSGNKLQIRTYDKRADGTVVNPWTAASTTGQRELLSLEKNGFWTQTRDKRTKGPFLTGSSIC